MVFEDVVDPLLQVVEDQEAVLFAHGLLDILEPGGAQNLDDLDVPDANEVGDPLCEGGSFVAGLDAFSSL